MKKRESRAVYWFIAGTVVVLLVPILSVLVDYQTFFHPWRPEIIASILLALLLGASFENEDFRSFLAETPKNEFRLLVIRA